MRYSNAAKLIFSYLCSRLTGKPHVWGMPVSLGVELTNHCNLRCGECYTGRGLGTREKGYMTRSLFEKINNQVSNYLLGTMFYFQGESMLHPHFFDFLYDWKGKGLVISTNGHFLNDDSVSGLASSPARKIIVSLDGFSQKVYGKLRMGGNVDQVKSGIIKLAEKIRGAKSAPVVELQFLVSRLNEHEITQVRNFAASLKVGFKIKSMQILDLSTGENLLPDWKAFNRYITDGDNLVIKSKLRNRCFRLWSNPVITWDGKVIPCCFDKDATYELGNIETDQFRDIWLGFRYTLFRKNILTGRSKIDICRNCTEGLESAIKR